MNGINRKIKIQKLLEWLFFLLWLKQVLSFLQIEEEF